MLPLLVLLVSATWVSGQQQYFRIQPRDAKIHEGGEVTLECEVANAAGAVQWTKDGFALGFSAVIPGYPRYSVTGDRRHGVYNLKVINASLEDDAEFQCQVGPARFHKAIRANAHLNVISPPSSIEMLDHASNSKIEIKENQEFHLECRVKNSKPAAKIVWYRGNVELNIDKKEDQVIEVGGNKNGDKRITRYDTHSRITLKPTAEDDYADYTCEARHEALSPDMPMRTTVQLSVLYPPGLPYIEGYTEGETIRRGQTVELVCRSRGGNPPAQLIWYKNGEQIRMAYRTAGRVSENVYTFTADASDNKARYKCEASNVMSSQPLKAEIDLSVLFSPSQVTISGPTEARVGDPVPLTCSSANSNPPAEIKWVVAGRQLRNGSTSRTVVSPEGGWITTSNITATVEPNRRSLVVICHGLNLQLTENVVSTHTINVLHPPSEPIIHGYKEGMTVAAGTVQKISCISSGGNPLASLTWYKNDKKINSVLKTTEKSVSAEITILTNVTDNEARYRCEAANAATEIPLFKTITMSVHFAPDNVKIRKEPADLRPNEEATLSCDSSSSNPPAKLSWWREGIPVHGLYNASKSGLHGGKVSSIELKLNVTEQLNGIVYTCQATNELLHRSVHDAITLQVLYKPVFEGAQQNVAAIENEPLIISLKAEGNPPNIAYTWTKDGLPIVQSSASTGTERILSEGSILNITKVSRHDAGVYTCEALNSQGSTILHVNVSVEYSATIKAVSENVIVNSLEDATLSCTAEGNPMQDDTITWKRDNFPDFEARTSVMYDKNGTSFLRISKVSRDDLGNFQCIANNGIGNQTVRQVMLVVKHKPELDQSPSLLKFASDAGDTGRIICRSRASPIARYTWARAGSPIAANTTGKYFTTFKQIDSLTSESILIVTHVASSDYGSYECVARNDLGFANTSPRLEVTSAPDTPTLLSVLNVTHDTVTLTWVPGFDGGMRASYRVRYRELHDDAYKYEDVLPYNVTKFTVNSLKVDTEYVFSIMAMNKLGNSKFMPDLTSAKTSNKIPPSFHSPSMDENALREFPGFLIIIGTIVGTALIIMNVLLIGCCLHRRSKKRLTEQSNQSSKTATIEMYAPSSYNDTVTGETLSSVSEKSETYSNEDSHNDYVDEGRKQAASTYLMDQQDYPAAYPVYPSYEMQIQPAMAHKTHTLPHPHHHQHQHIMHDRTRARDDQNLQYQGTMSAKSSYISAPSPAPPADGSYYNMSDRYLSYPTPLDYPPIPPHPHTHAPSPPSNGSLLRHQRIVPPDVLHNTNQNVQILQPQTLNQKRELSSFGNGYSVNENEGHLV